MNISLTDLLGAEFFLYAILAGSALALVAGPLGSFIVWRRMSYFGDTLAHSALLGVALGLLSGSNSQLSIILSCLALAWVLEILDRRSNLSTDTVLGILAHSTLAFGVVLLALSDSPAVNLEAYLFGALLTINSTDLLWVLGIVLLVAVLLLTYWNALLATTVHSELAQIEGINVNRMKLLLVVLIALTVAVAMKIVGVLLITSLLIIPPAAARQVATEPEQMAALASALGVTAVFAGLLGSFYFDVPAGPAIVVAATLIYLSLIIAPALLRR